MGNQMHNTYQVEIVDFTTGKRKLNEWCNYLLHDGADSPIMQCMVQQLTDGTVRVHGKQGNEHAWYQRMAVTGDNLMDFLRPCWDREIGVGSNGYYVDFANDYESPGCGGDVTDVMWRNQERVDGLG